MAAKDISLVGATFYAVPQVDLPISGGGTASFVEISDTTAAAADVASGKYFYTAAGVRTEGTASGGGGAGSVSSVQGATGDVLLDIAYDEQSSVGLAEVGTAITSEPNYTPTGIIEQTLESVEFMTGATGILSATHAGATLYLGFSFASTKTTKTIPTSAAVFNGNGVNLIIKERQ